MEAIHLIFKNKNHQKCK